MLRIKKNKYEIRTEKGNIYVKQIKIISSNVKRLKGNI